MKNLITLLIVVSSLHSISSFAQWSTNPYGNTIVCIEGNTQAESNVVTDGAGGAIISWADTRNDDGDIYAQRFDANGVVQWTANGIAVCGVAGLQAQPSIISDGNGGAIIVWTDLRNGNDLDVYAQHINGSGMLQWAIAGVPISVAQGDQTYPILTSDGNGGAIITWTDDRSLAGLNNDIYALGINANGTIKWTEVAMTTNIENQIQPAIISDNSGGVIITWRDSRNQSDQISAYDIYAQRLNDSGTPQWTADGVAICVAPRIQENPILTTDGSGGAIITWQDERDVSVSPTNIDIYAQRIGANGIVQWTSNGIGIATTSDKQLNASITSDQTGGAIIAWQAFAGSTNTISLQRVNSSGAKLWMTNGVPIGSGGKESPVVTSDGNEGALIVWEQSGSDLYAQHVDTNGAEVWAIGGVVISNAYGLQTKPHLVLDNQDGAIIAWDDYRNTLGDIYAQHIKSDGSLGGANILGSQTITFPAFPAKKFSDGIFTINAIASSNLAVTYTSSDVSVAIVDGTTLTIKGVGTATITANQAGNSNFSAAPPVSQLLTVAKGDQSITFNSIPPKVMGDTDFSLNATASSDIAVSYASSNTAVATVSGNTVKIVGVGVTNITASQAGNANYNAAANAIQPFTVKATQTITFNSIPTKALGDVDFSLNATASSGLIVSYASSNTAVATVSGNTVTIVGVGTTNITASQAGNANFSAAPPVSQVLTITKGDQTIIFNSIPTKALGDVDFSLNATASSGLIVSYASSNTAVATVSGNTVTIVGAGTTNLTASQAGNSNYNAASPVSQLLTVTKGDQTITFNSIPTKALGDVDFSLNATASSGLIVSYASSNTAVATVSGNTVTIVGGGTTNITASQAGNVNYNAAANVIQPFTVKASQSITFSSVPNKTLGDPAFTVSATSSASLPIVFSTISDKISISGNQISIVKAGSVTINADQGGNANFAAAPRVAQTFCVNPAKPTITTAGLGTEAPVLTSSSASGNQWFKDGVAIGGATTENFTVTMAGSYTVVVSADNCSSVPSNESTLVITGIENAEASVKVYPNPMENDLVIDVTALRSTTPAVLAMYDVLGHVLFTTTGNGMMNINVADYPSGVYLLKIQNGTQVIVKKLKK